MLLKYKLTEDNITKSNLTQTQKLGKVNRDVKITPNTPILEVIEEPILRKVILPIIEPPAMIVPTPDLIPTPVPISIGGGGGFTGEVIDDSRLGGGMGREQLFNNDGLNQQRENLR